MGRELKFRAWNKSKQKMLFPFSMEDIFTDWNTERALDKYENFEIMQFTGLKDKNGKEIYEGDLLKSNYQFSPNYEVFYWGAGFEGRCKPIPGISVGSIGFSAFEDMEIIGNVWETPALLKGGEDK